LSYGFQRKSRILVIAADGIGIRHQFNLTILW
jgi:hypothetical protein